MSEKMSEKEPWYQRWFVAPLFTIFAFLLLIVVYYSLFKDNNKVDPSSIISIPIIIIAATASLSFLIEKNKKKLSERITNELERVMEIRQSDLRRIAPHLSKPYLEYLRNCIFTETEHSLHQLIDEAGKIPTVEGCTDQLVKLIGNLKPEYNEILAVCGQKKWESPEVAAYYDENYEKAKNGVTVKRVFLQESADKGFENGEKKVLKEHLSDRHPNVEARVVYADDLNEHFADYKFPTGFGFAILGNIVLVHWGLGENSNEAGRKLDAPFFVEKHRQIFYRLWKIGKGKNKEEKAQIKKVFNL